MCGIAGILNLQSSAPISRELLFGMIDIQRHRGPDGSGAYIGDDIGLGHARLSIIDLEGGLQPIHNEDRSLWIVFNGEIFNYPEIRNGLVAKGHRFYTNTDTEVILHLFEERGMDCLCELNGQFALAIWDSVRKSLFLARDRAGIVPLHYSLHNGQLLFASEIKALLLAPGFPRRLDLTGVDQVFTFWTTLPGQTVFQGVQEVPPGTYLVASKGQVRTKRFWDFPFQARSGQPQFERTEEVVEEAGALLKDAIRIRLRADVPVGSYLSGGIDSSGLTALIRKNFKNRLKTFGITFEEGDFDERKFQEMLVRFLDVDHSAVNASNADICSHFASTLWHCEKPLLRTAPVPLFLLSKLVRECSYKVVVTGEGADEVFGGYNIFRETKVRAFWSRQPDSRLRPLLLRRLYPYIFKDERLKVTLPGFFRAGFEDVGDPFYSHLIRWKNTSKIKALFSRETTCNLTGYNALEDLSGMLPSEFSSWDPVSRAQYLEMKVFLSDYLLSSQGDRVAMGHSVEVRPPYLDHRLMELMATVPSEVKIRGLKEKAILKKVLKGALPEEILGRPKQPYRAPIRSTLVGTSPDFLEEELTHSSIVRAGIFDETKVSALMKKVQNAPRVSETDEMALAGIVSTQIIHKQFVEGFPVLQVGQPIPRHIFESRSQNFSTH